MRETRCQSFYAREVNVTGMPFTSEQATATIVLYKQLFQEYLSLFQAIGQPSASLGTSKFPERNSLLKKMEESARRCAEILKRRLTEPKLQKATLDQIVEDIKTKFVD